MRYFDYMSEIGKIRLLERDEEKYLWIRYKEMSDSEARCLLIEHYQPLVAKMIARWQVNDTVKMDLVQEGNVGLIEAVENFNPVRGVAFSLFAVHRIRGRMLNYFEREKKQLPELIDGDQQNDRIADYGPSVSELAEVRFLIDQLRKALMRLPFKERVAVSGIYIEGKEPMQMAKLLQVSPSHISRLQKQGIRRIRGMMSRLMAEIKK